MFVTIKGYQKNGDVVLIYRNVSLTLVTPSMLQSLYEIPYVVRIELELEDEDNETTDRT